MGAKVLMLKVIVFWRREVTRRAACSALRLRPLLRLCFFGWLRLASTTTKGVHFEGFLRSNLIKRFMIRWRLVVRYSRFLRVFHGCYSIWNCRRFFMKLREQLRLSRDSYRSIAFRYRQQLIKSTLRKWGSLTKHVICTFARGQVLLAALSTRGIRQQQLLNVDILKTAQVAKQHWARLSAVAQQRLANSFFTWHGFVKIQKNVKQKVFSLLHLDRKALSSECFRNWMKAANSLRMGRRVVSARSLSFAVEHLRYWKIMAHIQNSRYDKYLLLRNVKLSKMASTIIKGWFQLAQTHFRQSILLNQFLREKRYFQTTRILRI
eukprot:Gregarina_sp_Poly_1__7284@NODE_3_length_27868_cov_154_961188_g2_i0_p11_GENE_NODE_3_length_27868_cov_154_961188_g2_i0NODE_3_length_27868_cov_154_961188_g2_i0_p11_ORF_typecomplete_len321_score20_69Sfi1/PF08457_10/0_54DUF3890/PF13029_6/7_5e02DUF3890/PF13029_6/0_68PPTA/PF01239_22/0_059PPTA/PF01239_22/8e03DUF1866/PF08952_11/0_36_NODE_3_length_27868_cov_154_961188_g2_i076968658